MQIRPQWPLGGSLHVFDNNFPVTTYYLGPARFIQPAPGKAVPTALSSIRRPFFYPLNGPDGISLTEFGKPNDPTGSHRHHDSLWISHASVDGRDFWSERGGVIAHGEIEGLEDGPVFCRIIQGTRWMNADGEHRRGRRVITVYRSGGDFRILDLDLEFTPPGPAPVTLGKTSFGFLAARVARSMTVFDGGGEIINGRGDRNEQEAHLKRAPWIDLSGPVSAERWGGIAIFDHPENLNHPTGWHCRNDGWAGASFNMEGAHTIAPGEKLRLRYRILLHRHDALRGEVARRYEEYRSTPVISKGKPVRDS